MSQADIRDDPSEGPSAFTPDAQATQRAVERVAVFIAARRGAHGLDPDILTGYNDVELRLSDLVAILEDMERLTGRVDV